MQLRRNLHSNYNGQNNGNKNRSVSLVDRVGKLQTSQNSWQSKVQAKDVEKFTVAGKMKRETLKNGVDESRETAVNNNIVDEKNAEKGDGTEKFLAPNHANKKISSSRSPQRENSSESSPTHSPVRGTPTRSSLRAKRTPKPMTFKTSPPVQTRSPRPFDCDKENEADENSNAEKTPKVCQSLDQVVDCMEIEIPSQDNENLSKFFREVKNETKPDNIQECDFDLLLPAIVGNRHNSKLQHHKKDIVKVRKAQRRKPPTKNPLKSLAERSDIRQTYTESTSLSDASEGKTLEIDTTKKHALAETSECYKEFPSF